MGLALAVSADSDELGSKDPLAWLLQTADDLPPADLARAVSEAMAEMGARESCLYLADYDQRALHPFGPHAGDREPLDVEGTTGGQAFVRETRLVVDTDDGARMWLPLIDGTARIGVVLVLQALFVYTPFMQTVFGSAALGGRELLWAAAASTLVLPVTWLEERWRRARRAASAR